MSFFNNELLENFNPEDFKSRKPFPWIDLQGFLTEEAFQTLLKEFPSIELFEYHENIYRLGQRPHNRYYLAYERSVYKAVSSEAEPGIIRKEDLSPQWQSFMEEIEGPVYRGFIERALGTARFNFRYAWHVGKASNEVSPHRDNPQKLGTHILYFNTSEDWQAEWGGQLMVLGGKRVPGNAPDFSDFISEVVVQNMNNHSFLFKNTEEAWHGVKPLKCPEGKFRRLFNVIIMQ